MRKTHDWAAAALILLIGLGTIMHSLSYTLGTLVRMGPGYFPLVLGVLLTFCGLILLVRPSQTAQLPSSAPKKLLMRPWLAIIASMVVFIIVGRYGGLVPATLLLVFIAALGDAANSFKAAAILAILVTLAAVALFHYGMQLQFPLFRWG